MNDSIVPGVVYIHVGNEIQKLCETSDIHIETLANVPVSCDLPKLTEMETSASSLKLCPDNRVRHLVLHAKKKRTRKKNLHRIFRMLEKEKNYE